MFYIRLPFFLWFVLRGSHYDESSRSVSAVGFQMFVEGLLQRIFIGLVLVWFRVMSSPCVTTTHLLSLIDVFIWLLHYIGLPSLLECTLFVEIFKKMFSTFFLRIYGRHWKVFVTETKELHAREDPISVS